MLTSAIDLAKKNIVKFIVSATQKSVGKVNDSTGVELVRLGSDYGGYWVPKKFLDSGNSKSALSFGLGFDVSLDIKLLECGFIVLGVEPTKKSIEFVSDFLRPHIEMGRCRLVNSAVGGESGQIFYNRPDLKNNYKWWAEEDKNKENDGVFIPTVTLDDLELLCPQFFEQEILILKMDIEGAEIGVLRNLTDRGSQLDYLAVELDYISLIPVKSLFTRLQRVLEVRKILKLLHVKGYTLLKREEFNFFLINDKHVRMVANA